MDEETLQRIRNAYTGETGRWWRRIERECPATWLEENVVRGRRQVRDRLLERLQPLDGRRILDAGCGMGVLARQLSAHGARVTAVDLTGRFRGTEPADEPSSTTFVEGDFTGMIGPGRPRFDEIVLSEVLEDYSTSERVDLLRRVAAASAPRVWLVFRVPGSGAARLWDFTPDAATESIDSVELLRAVHTITPYRQCRGDSVTCRNYRAQLSELILDEDGMARFSR